MKAILFVLIILAGGTAVAQTIPSSDIAISIERVDASAVRDVRLGHLVLTSEDVGFSADVISLRNGAIITVSALGDEIVICLDELHCQVVLPASK